MSDRVTRINWGQADVEGTLSVIVVDGAGQVVQTVNTVRQEVIGGVKGNYAATIDWDDTWVDYQPYFTDGTTTLPGSSPLPVVGGGLVGGGLPGLVPGGVRFGRVLTKRNGVLADADSLPTVVVYRNNSVNNEFVMTGPTKVSTGTYDYSYVIPLTWVSGDSIRERQSALVNNQMLVDEEQYVIEMGGGGAGGSGIGVLQESSYVIQQSDR